MMNSKGFTELFESEYGTLLLHSFDTNQTDALKATKRAFDHDEFMLYKKHHEDSGGGIVLDVGANYGLFSLIMSENPDTKVYGFEPQPDVFNICCANIALHSRNNVRIFPFGVGNVEGVASFKMPVIDPYTRTSFGSHEIHNGAREYNNVTGHVNAFLTGIDWFVDTIIGERVNFIKIDVEGMELEVLRGAQRTLSRKDAPVLAVEILKVGLQPVIDTLNSFGYNRYEGVQGNIIAIKQ